MEENKEKIKQYYDEHISGKIKGFININERVERAWNTIIEKSKNPKNVLEIGCGIGNICWRMSKEWKTSKIFGIDISPRLLSMQKNFLQVIK